jgi:hypothetical protein
VFDRALSPQIARDRRIGARGTSLADRNGQSA